MKRRIVRVALALACLTFCASLRAGTEINGDMVITDASQIVTPVSVTGDATVTIAEGVTVFFGDIINGVSSTDRGHNLTFNLESGSSLQLSNLRSYYDARTTFNFKGGRLTDAGGFGSYWFETGSSSLVRLVSVDGNPIVFANVNSQWKLFNCGGQMGPVRTEGTGPVHILTDWMSDTTPLRLYLSEMATENWQHTGGTWIGRCWGQRNGWVVCNLNDCLPPGDIWLGSPDGMSGGVIELNWKSQTVDRIRCVPISLTDPEDFSEAVAYVTNDVNAAWGNAKLVFPNDNAVLDASVYGGVTVIKKGTGSFSIGCNAIPNLELNDGVTTICPTGANKIVQIGTLQLKDSARLTIDGATVRVGAYNGGNITLVNGGQIIGNLEIDERTVYDGATTPLVGSVTKTGSGTLYYEGDEVAPVDSFRVEEGKVVFAKRSKGTANTWWRFTVKNTANAGNILELGPMRLLDENLQFADGGATAANATQKNFSYEHGKTVTSYPEMFYDCSSSDMDTSGGRASTMQALFWCSSNYAMKFNSPKPDPSKPTSWIVWTYRIKSGKTICGYNLKSQWGIDAYLPRTWTLESSPTGASDSWELMDERIDYTEVENGQKWYHGGGYGVGSNDGPPKTMIPFRRQIPTAETLGGLSETALVRVDAGAELDCTLVMGGQTVSKLEVDMSIGGGTIKNVKFAASGILYLTNVAEPSALKGTMLPLTFVSAGETANVSGWTVYVNGKKSSKTLSWVNGGVRIDASGMVLIFR